MMGLLGWTWRDVRGLTYRQLVQAHDAKLVNQWDQSALLGSLLDGLSTIMVNTWGKGRSRPRGFYTFHPYRQKPKKGLVVTPDRIDDLRDLADMVFGSIGHGGRRR